MERGLHLPNYFKQAGVLGWPYSSGDESSRQESHEEEHADAERQKADSTHACCISSAAGLVLKLCHGAM